MHQNCGKNTHECFQINHIWGKMAKTIPVVFPGQKTHNWWLQRERLSAAIMEIFTARRWSQADQWHYMAVYCVARSRDGDAITWHVTIVTQTQNSSHCGPPSPPSLHFMVVPGPETRDLTECCSLINLILQLFSAAAIRYTALHYYTIIKITPEHIYFPCTACLLPDPVLPPCGGDMRGQCRPPAADLAPPSLVSSHTPGS